MTYKRAAVILTLFAGLTLCYLLGVMDGADRFLSDSLFSARRAANPNIFVIGIDEETLDQYGPWGSWSREVTSELIDYLNADPAAKPAVIGVDIMFFGNTTDREDNSLVRAAEKGGNVVLASQVVFAKDIVRGADGAHWDYGNIRKYEEPFDALKSVTRSGIMNVLSDTDGIVRNSLQAVNVDGKTVDSFANQMYKMYAGKTGIRPINTPPINGRGEWYIPFATKPGEFFGTAGKGTSWLRVMNGEIPRELFANSIVLVGPYSTGMLDSYFTSADRRTPMHGVEVHANILQSLIEGSFKRYVPGWVEILLAGLGALLLLIAFERKLSLGRVTLLTVGACVVYVVCAILLFHLGFIITVVYPILMFLLTYLAALVTDHILLTLEKARLYGQVQRLFVNSIRTIANTIDAKDPCTSGHCHRVSEYALLLGRGLHFDKNDLIDLEYAAILHDVGKIGVSDSVLKKDGPLTNEEYAEMKTHPMRGAIILDEIKEFKDHITDGARYHHERYDGKGYSEGLSGEGIPLFARIIAVADSYDAMTQNRPYRRRMPREEAIEELRRNAGTQFDPALVPLFIKLLAENPTVGIAPMPPAQAVPGEQATTPQ